MVLDVIGGPLVVALVGLFGTLAGVFAANRAATRAARGEEGLRRDARVAALEGQLDKVGADLAEARQAHCATLERLVAEEEELRDRHGDALASARTRMAELRIQCLALRAELRRRGADPDQLIGDLAA